MNETEVKALFKVFSNCWKYLHEYIKAEPKTVDDYQAMMIVGNDILKEVQGNDEHELIKDVLLAINRYAEKLYNKRKNS